MKKIRKNYYLKEKQLIWKLNMLILSHYTTNLWILISLNLRINSSDEKNRCTRNQKVTLIIIAQAVTIKQKAKITVKTSKNKCKSLQAIIWRTGKDRILISKEKTFENGIIIMSQVLNSHIDSPFYIFICIHM